MNILIIILIGIVIIAVLGLIAALFVKKEYTVERGLIINRPRQQVFNYIKFMKNQDSYNKWWMMDQNAKREYKGTDGSVGFIATWESSNKRVGAGEQEIKKITGAERIDFEIRFKKPFEGTANAHITTEAMPGDQTWVNWSFTGVYNYPMNLMNLFIDKILGRDLQTSIENLKAALEK